MDRLGEPQVEAGTLAVRSNVAALLTIQSELVGQGTARADRATIEEVALAP